MAWPFPPKKPLQPDREVTLSLFELLDEVDALEPGRAYRIIDRHGREFVIMPSADFEHIIGLAGLLEEAAV